MPSPPPAIAPPAWTTRVSKRRSFSRQVRMPQGRRASGGPAARIGGTSTSSSSTVMRSLRVRRLDGVSDVARGQDLLDHLEPAAEGVDIEEAPAARAVFERRIAFAPRRV